jgi:hypothetical protein
MDLYTKNGRPLQVSGTTIYSHAGKVVGRIQQDTVYATDGHYIGTIVGDRLVHRSTDRARISSSFSAGNHVGSAHANRVAAALWGEEPAIPD